MAQERSGEREREREREREQYNRSSTCSVTATDSGPAGSASSAGNVLPAGWRPGWGQ